MQSTFHREMFKKNIDSILWYQLLVWLNNNLKMEPRETKQADRQTTESQIKDCSLCQRVQGQGQGWGEYKQPRTAFRTTVGKDERKGKRERARCIPPFCSACRPLGHFVAKDVWWRFRDREFSVGLELFVSTVSTERITCSRSADLDTDKARWGQRERGNMERKDNDVFADIIMVMSRRYLVWFVFDYVFLSFFLSFCFHLETGVGKLACARNTSAMRRTIVCSMCQCVCTCPYPNKLDKKDKNQT